MKKKSDLKKQLALLASSSLVLGTSALSASHLSDSQVLGDAYQVRAELHDHMGTGSMLAEGSCGGSHDKSTEGKCGEGKGKKQMNKKTKKSTEAKCGADMDKKDKSVEGKCGEGTCGN